MVDIGCRPLPSVQSRAALSRENMARATLLPGRAAQRRGGSSPEVAAELPAPPAPALELPARRAADLVDGRRGRRLRPEVDARALGRGGEGHEAEMPRLHGVGDVERPARRQRTRSSSGTGWVPPRPVRQHAPQAEQSRSSSLTARRVPDFRGAGVDAETRGCIDPAGGAFQAGDSCFRSSTSRSVRRSSAQPLTATSPPTTPLLSRAREDRGGARAPRLSTSGSRNARGSTAG